MGLTNQQKSSLCKAFIHAYADHEREDGTAYHIEKGKEKEFIILDFPEIFKKMCNNILKGGFKKVERCSPSEANCIIRVYKKLHYKYEWGEIYNFYGACCYTKLFNKWVTSDKIDIYPIMYDSYAFRMILGPDETLCIRDADFADYYVRIS